MLPWLHEESVVDWEALELLGATVRRARLAHRLTQNDLGERVKLDQTSISLFELGRFPGLRVILFIRMATTLGLDIEALAPRGRFVDDAVLEALRNAKLEAEGRVCPSCRSELRTPIRTAGRPPLATNGVHSHESG
jgi:transcriptional regulator with XRE-family HTH domain